MAVTGADLLWGMEVDVAAAAAEIRAIGKEDGSDKDGSGGGSSQVNGFLGSIGLGALADQLKELRLSAVLTLQL